MQSILSVVISQPFVDVALSGAAHPDHLQSNVQAIHTNWQKDLAQCQEQSNLYWDTRSQLAWN